MSTPINNNTNTNAPPPVTDTSPTPDSAPTQDPGFSGDTQAASSDPPPTSFLPSIPDLRIPLNVYEETLGKARNHFTQVDRASDANDPTLTMGYYASIAEYCQLSRAQRRRLQNHFNQWAQLVTTINAQVATMNSATTVYNNQVITDNTQINALNAAIAQFNIDNNQANLDAAVATYNAYIATSNPAHATYDAAATLYNSEVAQNNVVIAKLNAFSAAFVPPLPQIPLESSVALAGQIAPFPAGPYVQPVATLFLEVFFPPQPLYPIPPPPTLFTDPNLPGNQKADIKRLLFSKSLLDKKKKHVDFVKFTHRGATLQEVDSYVQASTSPTVSQGAGSGETGLSSSLFGLRTNMLQGNLSLSSLLSALSTYSRGPTVYPAVTSVGREFLRQDVLQAISSLLIQATKQAAVAAGLRFQDNLKGQKLSDDSLSLLISSELAQIAVNFKSQQGAAVLQAIAESLVNGTSLQGADKQAAIAEVTLLLQNVLAQFALQTLSIALNAPGLIAQVLGNAAPEFANALKPPTEVEALNAFLLAQGIQLQDFKNALIDQLIVTAQIPRRVAVPAVDQGVNNAAAQAPFTSFDEFFRVLQAFILTGQPPTTTPTPAPTVTPTSEPNLPISETNPAPPIPEPTPVPVPEVVNPAPSLNVLPDNRINPALLQEAFNNAAVSLVNQLPVSTITGAELNQPSASDSINAQDFANSAQGLNVSTTTNLPTQSIQDILNAAAQAQPDTLLDFRNAAILEALNQQADLDQAIVLGNSLAEEVVTARVAQDNFSADNLNQTQIEAALTQSILEHQQATTDQAAQQQQFDQNVTEQQQYLQDQSNNALQQEITNQQRAAIIAQGVVNDIIVSNQRFASENDLRNFIRADLVTRYSFSVDLATRIANGARLIANRTGQQILSSIGANTLLSQTRLAEELNSLITLQFRNVLPPEVLTPVTSNIINNVIGVPTVLGTANVTQSEIDTQELNNPESLLRIISDTNSAYSSEEKQNAKLQLAQEFRQFMSPNIDSFEMNQEIQDPANIYLKSRFEGLSYARGNPSFVRDTSFRNSIDIII